MIEHGRRRRMNRRIFGILLAMSALMGGFLLRLAWLQAMPAAPVTSSRANLTRESVLQRERSLVLDSGRGDFLDRSGRPITGETYKALAVFPLHADARGTISDQKALAGVLGVNHAILTEWMNGLREPAFWTVQGEMRPLHLSDAQLQVIQRLRVNGVRVLPYRNRYPASFVARHAIGYTSQHPEFIHESYASELLRKKMKLSDQVGGAGLERALDRLLRGSGPTSVSYFTDGANNPLNGLDMRFTGSNNPYYPLKVGTTIDVDIQRAVEQYVDRSGLAEGAVVVLDADNGDIVTMVSRPQLAPGSIGLAGTDEANHAIRAVTPGSIFKLVTEAAALEANVATEREVFECSGDYGRYGLHCWKRGGHGRITLREALAQSCNIAFATVAERLSAEQFLVTANQLGMGRRIGWSDPKPFKPLGEPLRLLPEEEAGGLFAKAPAAYDGGQLAQTGIGQRDVRITPLQAANLVVTLLHEGRVLEPRLVSELRYANGQLMAKLPVQYAAADYGRIAPATAHALLHGMQAVVTSGTGRSIQDGIWTVAGKSGTAETLKGGKARNNQWFVGYGPVSAPRYAVAVLVENRRPDTANKATQLFRGIMDVLAVHEKASDHEIRKMNNTSL
ncbi:peptidoglycan D,D-transpeptidase FtsI family protein [Paenibacillus mendelii]|uniref:Peptidoglycan D,D-transpeptidase FtsI family protein n=1 Tax=Paenibacillus mendelii TaxID=206163 RepID=A0ABV6JB62_9BACL|nr:penicillin-binding protein 2 [Paenibacillus mendelii]MCQ6558500.1 penicillin-binding protein 2 [Paenibacillus mendelii]